MTFQQCWCGLKRVAMALRKSPSRCVCQWAKERLGLSFTRDPREKRARAACVISASRWQRGSRKDVTRQL